MVIISPVSSVFVRGFDFGTTKEQVESHCSEAGTVKSVAMQKGSAVVTFASNEEANAAVAHELWHEPACCVDDDFALTRVRMCTSRTDVVAQPWLQSALRDRHAPLPNLRVERLFACMSCSC